MNVILLNETELTAPLPRQDPRAVHIVKVLRMGVGDTFDVGLLNGPMGKATLLEIGAETLALQVKLGTEVAALHPVTVIIGLPRPASARRILKDLTSLGADALHFVATDKGEKSYRSSRLWSDGEYERLLVEGAEQAFSTRLPAVVVHEGLGLCLESLHGEMDRLALDNYEATGSLQDYEPQAGRVALAIGSERGWSKGERELFRQGGFALVSLGERVLKTETACIAGLAIVLEKLRVW